MWHGMGFPSGSAVKNQPANTEDVVLIPGLGRSAGEGYGNTLQYFCLEHPLVREAGRLQSMGSQRVGHKELFSD